MLQQTNSSSWSNETGGDSDRDVYFWFIVSIDSARSVCCEWYWEIHSGVLLISNFLWFVSVPSVSFVSFVSYFRFDCGSGTGKVRSTEMVVLNEWNTLTVYRYRWDAWILLNNGQRILGRSKVRPSLICKCNWIESMYGIDRFAVSLLGQQNTAWCTRAETGIWSSEGHDMIELSAFAEQKGNALKARMENHSSQNVQTWDNSELNSETRNGETDISTHTHTDTSFLYIELYTFSRTYARTIHEMYVI